MIKQRKKTKKKITNFIKNKSIDLNLSIIIINYNVKKKVIHCLKKIVNYKNSETIFIDNNSQDNSIKEVKLSFSNKIICVNNKKNIGFSKAVNQGIKLAKGDKILLLNPDTIPNHKSIKILENFIENNKNVGLVGGRMIKPKSKKIHGTYVNKPSFLIGIFEFTNIKKVIKNNYFSRQFYYKDEIVNKPLTVYGLSGGFLMFKKKLVKKIGFFDENFFMYLEDVDFGIRAINYGYTNYYLPNAQIIHDSGSSSKNKYKININAWRNSRNYFFKKYSNKLEWIILKLLFCLDDFIIDKKHKLFKEDLI